jgi:hypothetical protein
MMEVGEDLMTIEVGEKIEVRRPGMLEQPAMAA